MSDSLVPVFLALGAAVAVAAVLLLLTHLLGRPRKSQVDRTPYECGVRPFTPAQSHRYSVKFYLVAMLFILFDIEAAFLYPWAVTFRGFADDKPFVLGEMAVFLGILVAGFVYVWRRGALEWD
ncbi:MAG: NADH-quinone oxidoreductase subunit A [Acidobacteriia bacterium]|nr:NADH-quinone oxidoreductase subunit A [Terriglobia bacterium]